MSESFTVRTRKFMKNPLLGRRQFVVEVGHGARANVPKQDIAKKLAAMYKVNDINCIVLFGFKTAFGGGRSSGFGLVYENLDKVKKFEPKHRQKRMGIEVKPGNPRRAKKEIKTRVRKSFAKTKTAAKGSLKKK
eukprot:GEMP01043498.1.p1 GENE.GEMP01043498.1~~GEMP01043498.1.p1  ORF type:complete len:151 (+),score=29.92 GEMP01043498.1:53-454(+)